MEINKKLNTFIDVFFNESSMFNDLGSYSVRSALAAFGYDLGIIGDNVTGFFKARAPYGETQDYFTTLYQLLTLTRFYYDKDDFLDILEKFESSNASCKFASDKEALAHNLARLNMVQDQFNRHIMMRAVLTLARELRIISNEAVYIVLRAHPKSYDYYFNLEYYRKCLGIEVPSKEETEKQSESDHDHQQ